MKAIAFSCSDDEVVLHPIIPVALSYTALHACVAAKEDIVDAVTICLNAALDALWEFTLPLLSQLGKEYLKLHRRCSARCGKQFKACGAPIAICNDEFFSRGKNKRWFENLAFRN
ncbi:hypothetical protein BOSE62_50268 [Bosea sp. 62]|nr:hypothetical protein BOSE21B_100288 [Bosea sp. 21B]CAD5284583.1 hypothetical protein BOSE7B_41243 [Bosea sp. 7B]CAD5301695.1 hypothetical protein BOSE46_90652 [Bosea sp. 46]VVT57818.1 hypothetical protein BOS5A_200287 [Bosea sp. EC-HK365B]VXB31897.1 hypothetical protein BOSE29B_100093 [Bosea sp. 29B]VXB75885.1 hypothetical protein BOSE125_150093 [Bosea sp. 125]VXC62765.1 hypothetical protein BOSE62_50268 [Bosea sp. 62]VXC91733.1 hypothetical protein BOSE127_80026 [Bosea sp. 127]